MDALRAEDDTKVYKWDYFTGKYGHFTGETETTRTYPGGIDSIARFGHGGMNGWGATCGIPIASAMIIQLAVPDNQTPTLLDQLFANYGQTEHPQANVSNAAWFYDGVRAGQITRAPLPALIVGSMQCHNAVEQYIKEGNKFSPVKVRQEWCGRITADLCYLTLKLLNNYHNGTPYEATTLSAVPTTCHTSTCHTATQGRVIGKENCLVCHK